MLSERLGVKRIKIYKWNYDRKKREEREQLAQLAHAGIQQFSPAAQKEVRPAAFCPKWREDSRGGAEREQRTTKATFRSKGGQGVSPFAHHYYFS